jgi:hypothetical protein
MFVTSADVGLEMFAAVASRGVMSAVKTSKNQSNRRKVASYYGQRNCFSTSLLNFALIVEKHK